MTGDLFTHELAVKSADLTMMMPQTIILSMPEKKKKKRTENKRKSKLYQPNSGYYSEKGGKIQIVVRYNSFKFSVII